MDTGSTDRTKEIAGKFSDKVFDFQWTDDFSAARNFSMSKATGDWILVLDADEIISNGDMEYLRELLYDTENDAFYLVQRNYSRDKSKKYWVYLEKDEKTAEAKDYEGYARNPIIRLFKNKIGIAYKGAVHEILDYSIEELKLKSGKLNIPIHHYYDEKEKNSMPERQLKYLEIAEKMLKDKPDGRVHAAAGAVCLYMKKDYPRAIRHLEKAIALGYKENECLEGLAESHINMKEYEKAYRIYKQLAGKGILTSGLCNNLANLLVMHKHYRPALKYLKLALQLGNPNSERIKENIRSVEKLIEESEKIRSGQNI